MFGSPVPQSQKSSTPLSLRPSGLHLLALLLLAVLHGCQGAGEPVDCEEPEAVGLQLSQAGRFEEAAAEFRRAIEACGEDAGLLSDLGQALWNSLEYDGALDSFKRAVELNPSNPFMMHNLGALQHFVGSDLGAADASLDQAVVLAQDQDHLELAQHAYRTQHRCKAAREIQQQQKALMKEHGVEEPKSQESCTPWKEKVAKFKKDGDLSVFGPKDGTIKTVDVVQASELSYQDFLQNYALKGRPVVIKGITDLISRGDKSWELGTIKEVCGAKGVVPRVYSKDSTKWAGLEDADAITLGDFIDKFEAGRTSEYVFDWSLPKNCPQLLKDFQVPKYFAADLLQRFPSSNQDPESGVDDPPRLFVDSWPSLFIGPEGSGGGLHIDSFGSNFWMAVLSGQKLWQFFEPEAMPYLYPSHRDDSFGVNTREPDYVKYPLYAVANSSICVVGPGDGLFVPAGSPHQVTNLSPSAAISMNFVDSSNVERAISVTGMEALVDPEQLWIFDRLKAIRNEGKSLEGSGDDLPWLDFKFGSESDLRLRQAGK